jgi:hypothetical protein
MSTNPGSSKGCCDGSILSDRKAKGDTELKACVILGWKNDTGGIALTLKNDLHIKVCENQKPLHSNGKAGGCLAVGLEKLVDPLV